MKRLAIIILNYRTPQLTLDCLRSLFPEIDPLQHQVIVVDNASGDGSVAQIQTAIEEEAWQNWVTLLPSPVNGGFSAGNNLGINAIAAEAYLLLNSDTLIRPQAIKTLLDAMDQHPSIGIFSPRLEWPDETPQISCFRYHSPPSELISSAGTGIITQLFKNYDVPLPISPEPMTPQWTSFACVLIRREVIEAIGLMDEGYFMYYDDVDYCRRAQQAGWQILHVPQARVVHLRGGSGSVKADIASRQRPRSYLYQSRSRYFAKFYGRTGLWLANGCWLLGLGVARLREWVGDKEPHTCDYMEQDIWTNWRNPIQ